MDKLYRVGNFLHIEQGGLFYDLPIVLTSFVYNDTESQFEINCPTTQQWVQITFTDAVAYEDDLSVLYTVASMYLYLQSNTGYTNSVYVNDAAWSGFASYIDTAYTMGSPFSISSGVATILPNNAGVIYDDQKPIDIPSFYTGGKITGRNGDGLSIMIYFKGVTSSTNASLDIWIDIGGAVGELYRETINFRTTGVKSVLYTLPVAYTRDTWELNGATIYIQSSSNMDIYGINYNLGRTHKAK